MKRAVDILAALLGLIILMPLFAPIAMLVWLQDFHSPLYIASRVGKEGKPFRMVKLRSMIVGADRSGVESTSADDARITSVGRFIRKFKLDELTQLWNVLIGDMSLVGPRPNVKSEVDLYTDAEKKLLIVRPGVTDLASIVFSDEADILEGSPDPDLSYNQLIRPWKSRLGLIYVEHSSMALDVRLIVCTVLAIVSREKALVWVEKILQQLSVDKDIILVARRREVLTPFPPPGADDIVVARG